jgi:DNA-binding LytR/AlgR family response regulator
MLKNIFLLIRRKHFAQVNPGTILLIEATGNYAKFVTTKGDYIIKASISQLETQLPPEDFCRVHRSYIVAIAMISEIIDDIIHLEGKQIPLAKQYKNELLSRITIVN